MTVSDLEGALWRKSSRSGAGNDCVELVVGGSGVAVRDSKAPEAGYLITGQTGWQEFLGFVKEGRHGSR